MIARVVVAATSALILLFSGIGSASAGCIYGAECAPAAPEHCRGNC